MSFFKNLFSNQSEQTSIEEFLENLFQTCGFSLSCDVEMSELKEKAYIDIYGPDESLLMEQKGKLLLSFQTYISGVLQNRFKKDSETNSLSVTVDSGGYLSQYEQEILELAHRLKNEALRKKRPVFIKRPLNAFYRRKVHQDLTKDGRVATKSIGEGIFKTIKISPLRRKNNHGPREEA